MCESFITIYVFLMLDANSNLYLKTSFYMGIKKLEKLLKKNTYVYII